MHAHRRKIPSAQLACFLCCFSAAAVCAYTCVHASAIFLSVRDAGVLCVDCVCLYVLCFNAGWLVLYEDYSNNDPYVNAVSYQYYSELCPYNWYSKQKYLLLHELISLNYTSVVSIDPLREAAESGEGSPQCHPIQSPTHDSGQEVPPQDVQVGVRLNKVLWLFVLNYEHAFLFLCFLHLLFEQCVFVCIAGNAV